MSTQTIQQTTIVTPKARNAALWVVQAVVAAMFVMAGSSKLLGNPQMVGMFQAIGIGQWFRIVTGALEVTGALLLVIPALSGVGGLLLTGVMSGALLTHLFVIGGDPTMAIVLFVASLVISFARRDRTRKLLGR